MATWLERQGVEKAVDNLSALSSEDILRGR